ncbi:hypothetical protein [Enterococcus sp. HY326]|uniref:hypothetical protein n=1 Tax=Enterococcus sp. HY326 TaxID=2971265 RepID=UPI00223F42A1|nr:hypothetical protein [Enterococcus sp. HY326]
MKAKLVKLSGSLVLFLVGLFGLQREIWLGWGLPYFLIAFGCGLFGNYLGAILQELAFKKDAVAKKAFEIEENDECNVQIALLAKAKGFDLMTISLGALMLAYALMKENLPIVFSLVAVYLVIQAYALFWCLKLAKEM